MIPLLNHPTDYDGVSPGGSTGRHHARRCGGRVKAQGPQARARSGRPSATQAGGRSAQSPSVLCEVMFVCDVQRAQQQRCAQRGADGIYEKHFYVRT